MLIYKCDNKMYFYLMNTNHSLHAQSIILITGAAGFIASGMASYLAQQGFQQLILVDDFTPLSKTKNFENIPCKAHVDRSVLEDYLSQQDDIDFVIHLGARTDTTEMDYSVHEKWNLNYSKMIWQFCVKKQIPLIYASSAATYGNGEYGYDDQNPIDLLQPLNPYGVSKHEFDQWVLLQQKNGMACPPHWYGLKFFNVYGPNEYHKGRMASVIFHAFQQISKTGSMILFRSHHPKYKDGEQQRDFIYVKDIFKVISWLMVHLPGDGIFNLGTGHANTFLQLAEATFKALKQTPHIQFIDTPLDIRDKYQYFTEASMQKLYQAGYHDPFYTLQNGIDDYVKNYLLDSRYF